MPDKVTPEVRNIIHAEYMDRYHILTDLSSETTKIYHNALMTINAGAFGLSFTYILQMKDFVFDSPLWWIVLSWICMALSLIITLFSQLLGLKLIDDEVEKTHLQFDYDVGESSEEKDRQRIEYETKYPKRRKFITNCDVLQGIITSIGIGLLIFYASTTILKASSLQKKEHSFSTCTQMTNHKVLSNIVSSKTETTYMDSLYKKQNAKQPKNAQKNEPK